MSAPIAIGLGIIFSLLVRPDNTFITRRVSTIPLQIGVVILGLTIGLKSALDVGNNYFGWITLFVFLSFFGGLVISRILKLDKNISILISSGAAICGGTAIAAIAPIIKAKPSDLILALTIIFAFNLVALIFFPYIGSFLSMNSAEFGSFVALAVHDTSSVIGTALEYSAESVEVAASLKVARTLWLIPLIILLNFLYKEDNVKSKYPIFVFFFILAVLVNTSGIINYESELKLRFLSKCILMLGLFCIGTQTTLIDFKSLNLKAFALGFTLWLIAIPTAYYIVVIA
jgi:uncharacterized integral membrane protein (TIGR00698 family)